jgi:erythromycin esterase-like protein
MPMNTSVTDLVRTAARPLTGPSDLSEIAGQCANSAFVLIGEASHGTDDFYAMRADITRRLIDGHGFHAVVIEGDWPDAYRVNRYVRGQTGDASAEEALSSFDKFPEWMWRNTAVRDFVAWLRSWNGSRAEEERAGFYGMDLYSLHRSAHQVISYLQAIDPEAARRARRRYACFDSFGADPQAYGYAVMYELRASCEHDAIQQLVDVQSKAGEYARRDGILAEDEAFHIQQNARLVKNAEEYYRTMFTGRVSSWNLRDRHMCDTLDALAGHLGRHIPRPKIVVWAHNSHLGDARATETGRHGEWNVGQLMRERHPDEVTNIGFTTYTGTVMAAFDWGDPGALKRLRPGMAGSYELAFHQAGVPRFWLKVREDARDLNSDLLERAIGVIYRPETERVSHYFKARIAEQFDIIIHLDETKAVQPLDPATPSGTHEDTVAETFPSGV